MEYFILYIRLSLAGFRFIDSRLHNSITSFEDKGGQREFKDMKGTKGMNIIKQIETKGIFIKQPIEYEMNIVAVMNAIT